MSYVHSNANMIEKLSGVRHLYIQVGSGRCKILRHQHTWRRYDTCDQDSHQTTSYSSYSRPPNLQTI